MLDVVKFTEGIGNGTRVITFGDDLKPLLDWHFCEVVCLYVTTPAGYMTSLLWYRSQTWVHWEGCSWKGSKHKLSGVSVFLLTISVTFLKYCLQSRLACQWLWEQDQHVMSSISWMPLVTPEWLNVLLLSDPCSPVQQRRVVWLLLFDSCSFCLRTCLQMSTKRGRHGSELTV